MPPASGELSPFRKNRKEENIKFKFLLAGILLQNCPMVWKFSNSGRYPGSFQESTLFGECPMHYLDLAFACFLLLFAVSQPIQGFQEVQDFWDEEVAAKNADKLEAQIERVEAKAIALLENVKEL